VGGYLNEDLGWGILKALVFATSCLCGSVNAPLFAQQPTKVPLPVRADTTRHTGTVWKILGVFDDQGPIDSVEVRDIITGTHALTTNTGTVALSFLSRPAGTRILLRKIGYNAFDTTVTTGPADTVPLIIVMTRTAATALPTVVTSARATSLSSKLREFEERVSSGSGARFITPGQMRKEPDGRRLAELLLSHGIRPGSRGQSMGRCRVAVYQNGVLLSGADQGVKDAKDLDAVEYYAGSAQVPQQFAGAGASCGVIVYWTRGMLVP
jgi:hypothetical protein